MTQSLQLLDVGDAIITDQLERRPSRAMDFAVEAEALASLARELAEHPDNLLQKLCDTLVELGIAHSAGVSLHERSGSAEQLRWVALAGVWACFKGGVMPFDASPCGVVIARDAVLLFERPHEVFPAAEMSPLIHETLLVPFHSGRRPIGTLWINAHDPGRKFDAEDVRVLKRLGQFASAAYQMTSALDAAEAGRIELERRVAERTKALRESEERHAVLLQVSDEIRSLKEPGDIAETAARRLGRQLGASRVCYGEIGGDRLTIERDYAQGVPSIVGDHSMRSFDREFIDAYQPGRVVTVNDVGSDPRLSAETAAELQSRSIAAFVDVVLLGDDRRVSLLAVQHAAPRAWTESENALIRNVGERVRSAIERARTDVALARNAERQALLLELSDAIRTVSDPATIQRTAMRLLGDHLGLSQAYYFDVLRENGGWVHVIDDAWQREPAGPSMIGRHALAEFGDDMFEGFARGEVISAEDVGALPNVTPAELASYRALGVTAFINVPLLRDGDYGAGIGAHDTRPHAWTEDEISLIRQVAERTWAAIERSRSEAALREKEADLAYELANIKHLQEVSGLLIEGEDNQILYGRILDAAMSVMSADFASLQMFDHKSGELRLLGHRNFHPRSADHWERVSLFEESTCNGAARDGERTVVLDASTYDPDGREFYDLSGIVSVQSTPLTARNGQLIGMLSTYWRRPTTPDDTRFRFLDILARQTADAFERSRSEASLRESEEQLRQFGEASQDILWIRDAATLQWTYLTPAFEAIYGLSCQDALTGDNYHGWQDLIVPEDRAHAAASIRRVGAGEHVVFEYRIRRPSDGEVRWLRNTDFPMRDETGRVVSIGGVGHDITALKAIETALTESEGHLRDLVEGVSQLVWRALAGGEWIWASPQWTAFTGQSEPDSRGLGWLDPVHPADREVALVAWDRVAKLQTFEAEYRIRHAASGEYRWFQTRAAPRRGPGGEIVEWLGTSTDVHQLKALQQSQAVMVAELQHRTRNLIAVVRSIADDTMEQTGPTEAFRPALANRLSALSRVQGLLSRAEVEPITMEAVVRLELDALGAQALGDRVVVAGPGVWLRNSAVQTLALALHELATNARKHGALSHDGGRLAVTWSERILDGKHRVCLEWVETGLEQAPARTQQASPSGGYGRELIEQALPHALGAKTSYVLTETGVRCTIDLPSRPASHDGETP